MHDLLFLGAFLVYVTHVPDGEKPAPGRGTPSLKFRFNRSRNFQKSIEKQRRKRKKKLSTSPNLCMPFREGNFITGIIHFEDSQISRFIF